mmetsp:Transcript_6457/g.11516  ORF Transcript_6457/g.11516 Transcript_6457/m.11516 type:complete len:731 (-) Transcript_6457:73-2265(-)
MFHQLNININRSLTRIARRNYRGLIVGPIMATNHHLPFGTETPSSASSAAGHHHTSAFLGLKKKDDLSGISYTRSAMKEDRYHDRFMSSTIPEAWEHPSATSNLHLPKLFNDDIAPIYARLSEAHRHSQGPWDLIVSHVERALQPVQNLKTVKILDLASGPGEPAALLAQEFPESTIVAADISPEMVHIAKAHMKTLGLKNADVQVVNMEHLERFSDNSFDVVTCSYGLTFCQRPDLALAEVHRVLKPGGTFVTTVWESVATERISRQIMNQILEYGNPSSEPIIDPVALSQPRLLEQHIFDAKLAIIHVDHGEYPIMIPDVESLEEAFKLMALPIYHNLTHLEVSGECPDAFEKAKDAFRKIVEAGDIISLKEDGTLVTAPNRFKLVVASRKYEDEDGKQKSKKKTVGRVVHQSFKNNRDGANSTTDAALDTARVSHAFDSIMADTYRHINNGPWNHILKAIDGILYTQSKTSAFSILDIAAGTGELSVKMAKRFPHATITTTDISPDMVKVADERASSNRLSNMKVNIADAQNLSNYPDASFDIVVCSFGLMFFPDPSKALQEIRRVLHPRGTLIATVWDSISMEPISDVIMEEIMFGRRPPQRVIDHRTFAAPHKLENAITKVGMKVMRVDKDEFRIQLSGLENEPDDFAFQVATIPIHPNLVELETTGENPRAFEDAKQAFDRLVEAKELVTEDIHGHLMTPPNRFSMIIARRPHLVSDGYLETSK